MSVGIDLNIGMELPPSWTKISLGALRKKNLRAFSPASYGTSTFELYSVPSHEMRLPEIVQANRIGSNKQYVDSGDVLISKINPRLNRTWVVGHADDYPQIASTEWVVFANNEVIQSELLAYILSDARLRDYLAHNSSGVGGSLTRFRPELLDKVQVGLPPAKEQIRIVAVLEELFSKLDKGVQSLTVAREQLNAYRQSVLKHAFEGKLTTAGNSRKKAWPNVLVGEVIEYLTSGSRGWAAYYADAGDIFIRAQNLKHDRLNLNDIAYVKLPPGSSEGVRTRVKVGDVLITITGANVTKTGIVECDLGTAYVSQHVALCRPGERITPEYLYWFLLAEAGGRKQLNKAAYGAGKPGLNLDNIREVNVPLPSPADQRDVVAAIRSAISIAEHLNSSLEEELARISALKQSILKRAFAGQLVAQDPADEPASALLDRIRGKQEESSPKQRRNTKKNKKEAA